MDERPIDHAEFVDADPNYWRVDPVVRAEAERCYDPDEFAWAESRLDGFGAAVGETIAENAAVIDRHGPELHTYDRDGEPLNRVEYHPAQRENERLTYGEFGAVADSFRAPAGRDHPMPLAHNLTMQYLLSYADAGFDCPMSMTAGVALVLEQFADDSPKADLLGAYFDRLTTTDLAAGIEGAMFLTETQGGSDVGATETVARYDGDADCYRLTGEKWFCSNIDAEGTLALARIEGAPTGTEGLSLFLVPHTTRDGVLNDQLYRRLKDKLGTISVPTGEVEFRGAKAYLVGEPERGFKQMAEMLNFERLSNAMGSCGLIGRARFESTVRAATREAFGRTLDGHPLMRRDLVDMAVDHEAATAFVFEATAAFSAHHEARRAGDRDETAYRLMRALCPVAKARTARLAVDTASYAMEIHGGNGYVAEWPTHRLLRDAQVLPIWEGTENVLSLELLRALDREDAHEPLSAAIVDFLEPADDPAIAATADAVREAHAELGEAMATLAAEDADYAQLQAKELLHFVYDVFTSAALCARAAEDLADGDARAALVARRFVDRHLREERARGIPGGDRFADDHFDAVVRFAPVDPATLGEPAAAD